MYLVCTLLVVEIKKEKKKRKKRRSRNINKIVKYLSSFPPSSKVCHFPLFAVYISSAKKDFKTTIYSFTEGTNEQTQKGCMSERRRDEWTNAEGMNERTQTGRTNEVEVDEGGASFVGLAAIILRRRRETPWKPRDGAWNRRERLFRLHRSRRCIANGDSRVTTPITTHRIPHYENSSFGSWIWAALLLNWRRGFLAFVRGVVCRRCCGNILESRFRQGSLLGWYHQRFGWQNLNALKCFLRFEELGRSHRMGNRKAVFLLSKGEGDSRGEFCARFGLWGKRFCFFFKRG